MVASKDKSEINKIEWIEKGILENPLPDHRKYIIWRILSPYLIECKEVAKGRILYYNTKLVG